jgi:uncharacterized membrane protein (DUF485 family)
MQNDIVDRVRSNPKYQKLVADRTSFGWTLSVIMLAIYYGFIAVIAFKKELLGIHLGTGVTTVGIVVGLAVIVSAFLLTGIYVRRANSQYDALIRDIVKETK